MSCEAGIREQLSAYLDGELDSAEASAVAAHLQECASCSRLLERLGTVRTLLAGAEGPSPAQVESLRSGLHAGLLQEAAMMRRRRRRLSWVPWAGGAAAAVFLLAVSLSAGVPQGLHGMLRGLEQTALQGASSSGGAMGSAPAPEAAVPFAASGDAPADGRETAAAGSAPAGESFRMFAAPDASDNAAFFAKEGASERGGLPGGRAPDRARGSGEAGGAAGSMNASEAPPEEGAALRSILLPPDEDSAADAAGADPEAPDDRVRIDLQASVQPSAMAAVLRSWAEASGVPVETAAAGTEPDAGEAVLLFRIEPSAFPDLFRRLSANGVAGDGPILLEVRIRQP